MIHLDGVPMQNPFIIVVLKDAYPVRASFFFFVYGDLCNLI